MKQTCWNVCTHCGDEVFFDKGSEMKWVLFALCSHPTREGEKRYEPDVVCEHVARRSAQPQGPGWDDY